MSENRKALHEPLIRIVKRDGISFRKKALIRAASIVLALVADALFIYFVTGLNPLSVYAVMFNGTFSTTMRFMWAMRDLASLLLIGIALAPAFKMRFWNVARRARCSWARWRPLPSWSTTAASSPTGCSTR